LAPFKESPVLDWVFLLPIRGANPSRYPLMVQKRVQNEGGLTTTLRFCATQARPAGLEGWRGLHDLSALRLWR